ncbi:hypothetical protein E2C01_048123 [Portunus trituberculatus]|uniref:Uncharacterized protein n=1 Tax=Portunus trituberculatus TaxID=210409 RepID=A0A5B7G9V5_PORTR|nr:hypothetical protein [Portunus trituberculatus]
MGGYVMGVAGGLSEGRLAARMTLYLPPSVSLSRSMLDSHHQLLPHPSSHSTNHNPQHSHYCYYHYHYHHHHHHHHN